MRLLKIFVLLFVLFYLLPAGVAAGLYWRDGTGAGWRIAGRSAAPTLPQAADHPAAVVRVFAAQAMDWRGILAVHCWLVLKPEAAAQYTRYDYTAFGEPIGLNGFAPGADWFGHAPDLVFSADGPQAAALIPRLLEAIKLYSWHSAGDYLAWPGPNSNTFVAAVLATLPEIRATLPPTAIGRDFPYDGQWLRPTPSGTGYELTFAGYVGVTLGWVEGIEVNLLGAVAGLDIRRPALTLPGFGRLGVARDAPSMTVE
jgi:hypothetical protein